MRRQVVLDEGLPAGLSVMAIDDCICHHILAQASSELPEFKARWRFMGIKNALPLTHLLRLPNPLCLITFVPFEPCQTAETGERTPYPGIRTSQLSLPPTC